MDNKDLIKSIQSIVGTTVDGIIGPKTLSAIYSNVGNNVNDIKSLQKFLRVTSDGIIGPKTLEALLNYLNKKEDILVSTTVSSDKANLVCISIGHSSKDEGAWSSDNKLGEYTYNKELASMIQSELTKKSIKSVISNRLTNGGGTGVSADIKAINATGASICIELHANAFNGKATGTETLYWNTSTNGKKLATLVQEECVKALGLTNRGIKALTGDDRGGNILRKTNPVTIITEPFFIDTPLDLSIAISKKSQLALGIAKAIIKYFQ